MEKNVLKAAEQNRLVLTEPIDFVFEDKVVLYDVTGLDYTFIFFALKKLNLYSQLKLKTHQ
jgi:hypothetical protein